MLADPKAVQHVLHKPGYHYDKAAPRAHFNQIVVGKGLVAVTGSYSLRMAFACRSSESTPKTCR